MRLSHLKLPASLPSWLHSPWTDPLGIFGPAHPRIACGHPGEGEIETLWERRLSTHWGHRIKRGAWACMQSFFFFFLDAHGYWCVTVRAELLVHGLAESTVVLTMATSFFSSSSSFSFCFFLPPPFSAVVAAGEYSRPACKGKGGHRVSGRLAGACSHQPWRMSQHWKQGAGREWEQEVGEPRQSCEEPPHS